MKKRILPLFLALSLSLSLLPAVPLTANAEATYNVANAIAYGAAHYNDKKGMCAEFASDVLNAGGLNMKMQKRVISCMKTAEKVTGLTRVPLILTPKNNKNNDTSEMATYELDGEILAAGDLVIQTCHTHGTSPHAVICAGYDKDGYAVFYSHTPELNKRRYSLGFNNAYEHSDLCDMRAYVLQVSRLDPSSPYHQKHVHSFNSVGRCTVCGQQYALHFTSRIEQVAVCVNGAALKVRPYDDADTVRTLSRGEILTVNAKGENAFGEVWYRFGSSSWIKEKDVSTYYEDLQPETTAAPETGDSSSSFAQDMINAAISAGEKAAEEATKETISADAIDRDFNFMYTTPDPMNEPETTAAPEPETTAAPEPETSAAAETEPETTAQEAPDIQATKATKITATTVQVNGTCGYSGKKPSSVGLYFGTSKNSMSHKDYDNINHNKNPFDIWYNLSGLSPDTTYYYQLYAIVDGQEYLSSIKSFTTKTQETDSTSQAANITIKATKATKVKKTTAQVNGNCKYGGKRPSSVGLYFGTSQDSMTKKDSDKINHKKNPFDIWYNLSNLSPGTTYYYQLYAIVDGTEYLSNVLSFTTAK